MPVENRTSPNLFFSANEASKANASRTTTPNPDLKKLTTDLKLGNGSGVKQDIQDYLDKNPHADARTTLADLSQQVQQQFAHDNESNPGNPQNEANNRELTARLHSAFTEFLGPQGDPKST